MIFGTTAQSLVDFATLKADCEDSRFNAQCASGICNDKTSKFKVWKYEIYLMDIPVNMMINAYVQLTNVIEHGEECYRDSNCLAGR